MWVRSALACAGLLVVTADLDVMDVYLQPYLQTYLPFVLAVPFATLALFLASTLRATGRTLGSVIVSTYSINSMIIIAAVVMNFRAEDRLSHSLLGVLLRLPAGSPLMGVLMEPATSSGFHGKPLT